MKRRWLLGGLLVLFFLAFLACGSSQPTPVTAPPEDHDAAIVEEPDAAAVITTAHVDAPFKPSTASYEQVMEAPESLDQNDDHAHLSDSDLTKPMQGVVGGCNVPSNARVTIKTAVRNSHAIGVTVSVAFSHPRTMKRLPPSAVRYEAKLSAKIIACVDKKTRALTWPPSPRRDSFTTTY